MVKDQSEYQHMNVEWCHLRCCSNTMFILLEEAPSQTWRQAVKDAGWKLEDGAQAGLQCCWPPTIDHHHLVDQVRVFVGQEGTK